MKKGVYTATKKDGTLYYRSSITFQNKHISLGSFSSEDEAAAAYLEAEKLVRTHVLTLDRFAENCTLSFAKWVCLLNFRDNGMYIKTPIYLKDNYFCYYFSPNDYYIFDIDDLFYYSTHSIMRRRSIFSAAMVSKIMPWQDVTFILSMEIHMISAMKISRSSTAITAYFINVLKGKWSMKHGSMSMENLSSDVIPLRLKLRWLIIKRLPPC